MNLADIGVAKAKPAPNTPAKTAFMMDSLHPLRLAVMVAASYCVAR
jgi:hypothetical protein